MATFVLCINFCLKILFMVALLLRTITNLHGGELTWSRSMMYTTSSFTAEMMPELHKDVGLKQTCSMNGALLKCYLSSEPNPKNNSGLLLTARQSNTFVFVSNSLKPDPEDENNICNFITDAQKQKLIIYCNYQNQFISKNGRYVMLQRTPGSSESHLLDFCELQVMSCPVGFWKLNCSQECPECPSHTACGLSDGRCFRADTGMFLCTGLPTKKKFTFMFLSPVWLNSCGLLHTNWNLKELVFEAGESGTPNRSHNVPLIASSLSPQNRHATGTCLYCPEKNTSTTVQPQPLSWTFGWHRVTLCQMVLPNENTSILISFSPFDRDCSTQSTGTFKHISLTVVAALFPCGSLSRHCLLFWRWNNTDDTKHDKQLQW